MPVVVAGLLGLLGLAIVVGPWALRLVDDLSAERAERITRMLSEDEDDAFAAALES